MRIATLVLAATLTVSTAAGETAVSGVGATPCSDLNLNVRPGSGYMDNTYTTSVMSWVQGFVSGINVVKLQAEKRFFDLASIDVDEQWAFVVAYCRRNPAKSISHAANDLIFRRLVVKSSSR
jgi:hypothetical protein